MEVTTRAVKVEALKLCSAYSTSEISKQRTTSGAGTAPKHMWKKFSAYPSSGSGAIGSRPRRRRRSAATTVGSLASRVRDLARPGTGRPSSSVGSSAPKKLTAVRSTSIGWQVSGSRASSSAVVRSSGRSARSRARNSRSCAASGSSPYWSRWATSSKERWAANSWTG